MTTLADLRKASLAEQKAPPEPPAAEASLTADTESRKSVSTDLRDSASTEARTQGRERGSTGARKGVSAEASTPALTEVLTDGLEDADADIRPGSHSRPGTPARRRAAGTAKPAAPAGDPFLERVREAIGRKTVHPGGVKATVDMAPDLSLRAKRYCLEHGNVPVRQVFLELMEAFLAEEGY